MENQSLKESLYLSKIESEKILQSETEKNYNLEEITN
jgi:hypothetical protein